MRDAAPGAEAGTETVSVAEPGSSAGAEVDLGPMAGSLGFLLRIAQLQAFERFYTVLEGDGVRPGSFTILSVIGRNPGIRQGVLAGHLMIKRAHMTKIVRALEGQGLVSRRVADDDRRAMELTLTPAGQAWLAAREPAVLALDAMPPPGLSTAETARLTALLRKLTGL